MTPVITPAFEKVVYSLHAQRIIVVKEGSSRTDALIMIQHKVCKFLDDTNIAWLLGCSLWVLARHFTL